MGRTRCIIEGGGTTQFRPSPARKTKWLETGLEAEARLAQVGNFLDRTLRRGGWKVFQPSVPSGIQSGTLQGPPGGCFRGGLILSQRISESKFGGLICRHRDRYVRVGTAAVDSNALPAGPGRVGAMPQAGGFCGR